MAYVGRCRLAKALTRSILDDYPRITVIDPRGAPSSYDHGRLEVDRPRQPLKWAHTELRPVVLGVIGAAAGAGAGRRAQPAALPERRHGLHRGQVATCARRVRATTRAAPATLRRRWLDAKTGASRARRRVGDVQSEHGGFGFMSRRRCRWRILCPPAPGRWAVPRGALLTRSTPRRHRSSRCGASAVKLRRRRRTGRRQPSARSTEPISHAMRRSSRRPRTGFASGVGARRAELTMRSASGQKSFSHERNES